MKKSLLFVALLIGGLTQLNAQCTITPGCTLGSLGYCTTPAENTALPNGTALLPYSTVIQLSLGTTFAGSFPISDATISGVTGMPAGFTYSTNPSNGVIVGGANGCLFISGTPASAGTYTVGVGFNVNVTGFPSTTQTLNYILTIDPSGATSVKSYNAAANFFIAPNPVSSELFISSANHFGKVQIIDALGKIVISHDANYALQTIINVSQLNKGVYFLQVNDGDKVITRKFIKD